MTNDSCRDAKTEKAIFLFGSTVGFLKKPLLDHSRLHRLIIETTRLRAVSFCCRLRISRRNTKIERVDERLLARRIAGFAARFLCYSGSGQQKEAACSLRNNRQRKQKVKIKEKPPHFDVYGCISRVFPHFPERSDDFSRCVRIIYEIQELEIATTNLPIFFYKTSCEMNKQQRTLACCLIRCSIASNTRGEIPGIYNLRDARRNFQKQPLKVTILGVIPANFIP